MSEIDDHDEKPEGDDTVEVFQRINHLKRKAGGDPNSDQRGQIPEALIRDADKQIEEFCKNCSEITGNALRDVIETWQTYLATTDAEKKKELIELMFTQAHEIKDVAGTCSYILISHFAESLRDYVRESRLDLQAHHQIIQAHIDVMSLAFKNDIKDDGGPVALELQEVLKKAIQQYQ